MQNRDHIWDSVSKQHKIYMNIKYLHRGGVVFETSVTFSDFINTACLTTSIRCTTNAISDQPYYESVSLSTRYTWIGNSLSLITNDRNVA